MDIFISVNIAVTGFMIGFIYSDLKGRQKIREELKKELESLRILCSTVNESHNKLVENTKKISDRVAAFEMGSLRK